MKIQLPKGTKFKEVLIKSCHTKTYPQHGPYQGGIVFNRYYGMGEGIGFTAQECESMWGSIKLEEHYMEVKQGGAANSNDGNTTAATTTQGATPVPAGTPATDGGGTPVRQVGDCLEVWWEDHDEWFPCVVREQADDYDGSLASCCHYDDGIKEWHNLDNESYRVIAPTAERVGKLYCKNIRERLSSAGVGALTDMDKKQLVTELVTLLSAPTTPTTTITPSSTTTTSTPTTTITPSSTTATTTITATATSKVVRLGDSLEVWWDEEDRWYPCVVSRQKEDVEGSLASCCHYDDGIKEWHNLEDESYRVIAPTAERIGKLCCKHIRERLSSAGVGNQTNLRKVQLVTKLVALLAADTLSATGGAPAATVQVNPAAIPATAEGYSPAATPVATDSDSTMATEIATDSPAPELERAKHGESHGQRMARGKRKNADRELASENHPPPRKRRSVVSTRKRMRTVMGKRMRTTTDVVHDIGNHGMALYTLSTRGSRRNDRQYEREDYNLIIFSRKQMLSWDPTRSHTWRAGDKDMALLHENIRSFYDTTGWEVINTMADGDGVVFRRPPPPVNVRGCGALAKRKNFVWTKDMSKWLMKRTHHLTFKSTPFVALVLQAEQLWGYTAPKQEHIENKIHSRDTASKEGRTVQWVKDADEEASEDVS